MMAQIIWVCISVLEEEVIESYISIHIMQNIAVGNMKLRLWAYFGTPITNWEIGDSEQELQELDKKMYTKIQCKKMDAYKNQQEVFF